MNLFDRYTGKPIFEKDLPDQIDFGRFIIIDSGTKPVELTYASFPTNKLIHQELLLEKYKSLQEVLLQISNRTSNAKVNVFEVVPLIQRIKDKLGLNDFELMLCENVFHLEEIFRQPHYLLEREIEKVHVSRAKRIPSKSYQYLASHTEDWIHKSIVNFKPSRILNEELVLNFDIYENQLAVAFIERCMIYLNSRLKEIQDIKSFLAEYEKLFHNHKDDKGWYKKIERNLRLIAAVYEDEHYHSENIDSSTLTETEKVLTQVNKRLLILRKSELFELVNKRISQSILLRNTNVLVNHKHYRYVKKLWFELDKIKPEKSDKEKSQFEQKVFEGLRAYAKTLVSYCLTDYLGYELSGNYSSFVAKHQYFPSVMLEVNKNGVINLQIGDQILKFIVIGNEPIETEILSKLMVSQKAYILFFSEKSHITNDRIIHINPLDPDSCERVASVLRKYILKDHLANIRKEHKFAPILKDYTRLFPNEYLSFDRAKYSYTFISYPHRTIIIDEIQNSLLNDVRFKSIKSRNDKEFIQKNALELANQINNNIQKLKNEYLHCISCGEFLGSHSVNTFDYISCQKCNRLLDSSKQGYIVFKITKAKYESLSSSEWGMDYLKFNLESL